MRQSVRPRTESSAPHPPYGLYPDPHAGMHDWWAVDARTLLGLVTVLASLGAVLTLAGR